MGGGQGLSISQDISIANDQSFMISSLTGQVRILFTSTCTLRILLARKGQDLDGKTLVCTHKSVSGHILSGMTFIDIYDLSISSLSVSNRNSFIS